MTGLNLSDRNLTGADLTGSDLTGTILDRAKLSGVLWGDATCPDGTRASDHEESCAKSLLKPGNRKRPLAIGESVRIGDWRLTVRSLQANAASNRIAVEDYNLKPGTGYVYAIARIDAEWVGPGQGMVSDLNLEINKITAISDGAFCSLLDLEREELLNTGQSTSFRECIYLPKTKIRSGVLAVYAGYSFDGAPAAYWAVP